MFKVTLGGYDANKKINDIKALRSMFAAKDQLPGLTVSKEAIEAVYATGKATLVASVEQVAHMATFVYGDEAHEYSFWVEKVEPFERTDYFDLTR